ncbi:hypothetical protein DSL72_006171 [Monilinia vaccinii-corymbosi]|uniref:CRAL-TRIO domain-containing protein n=1 Tax=Monilinia vaccinii-corymbosi TaxID=61207 RepID=A0A8A3PGZ8_9HELO|nr:hypothetical protein DSL72_006171 [Monilinia vaccinii-corymbosi]
MSSGPAHRVQSAVIEYGFPQGHLGHLSTEEEAALNNFKFLCTENGVYKPGNGNDEPPSHEDATLLRFLRARRFVVADAYQQFSATEEWRKENELDQLYETIDLEQYEETRRLYPQWIGRRDRRGIPVFLFEVSYLTGKRMSAYEKSAVETHAETKGDGKTPGKFLRLFALYENLTRFVMPLCTVLTDRENPHTPITQSNNIVDISGVGLKQFWNLRGHMQNASSLATAHYPETLDRIFIIGAPSFFPTVWGWIKRWFDPLTTSKIFIINHNELRSTLEAFIEPRNIPKKYGGELDFEFGDMPTLDPALAAVISWNEGAEAFPGGPMYWVNTKDQESIQAIAVGSKDKKQRREEVCTVKKPIKDNDNKGTIAKDATAENTPIRSGVLAVPTAGPSVVITTDETNSSLTQEPTEEFSIQNGELVFNKRPELETFHTAQEIPTNLSLTIPNEVQANGTGSHTTTITTQLDENINHDTSAPSELSAELPAELSKISTQKESINGEQGESINGEQREKVAELSSPIRASAVGSEGRNWNTMSLPSGGVSESEKIEEKMEKRRTLLGGLKGKLTGH